jgi:hypothetical protein
MHQDSLPHKLTDIRLCRLKSRRIVRKISDGGLYVMVVPTGGRTGAITTGSTESKRRSHLGSISTCRSTRGGHGTKQRVACLPPAWIRRAISETCKMRRASNPVRACPMTVPWGSVIRSQSAGQGHKTATLRRWSGYCACPMQSFGYCGNLAVRPPLLSVRSL